MSTGDWIGVGILFLFGGLFIWGVIISPMISNRHQRKRFNGGKCPHCGVELKFFRETNEEGTKTTYYRCPKCLYLARCQGYTDFRYCDIFDVGMQFKECETCGSRKCQYYRNGEKEKPKNRKIPPGTLP